MTDAQTILTAAGWLSMQPEAFRSRIIAAGRSLTLARDRPVYLAGDGPGGMFAVLSGSIGAFVSTRQHLPKLSHIVRAGRWFGVGPIATDRPRTLSFVALEPAQLFQVPLAALRQISAEDSEAARRIGAMSELGVDLAVWCMCDLLIPDAGQRLAAVLLRVTIDDNPLHAGEADGYRITQTQLGEMANMSRNSVNRLLATMQANGWISISYNRMRIVDAAALRAFAFADDQA